MPRVQHSLARPALLLVLLTGATRAHALMNTRECNNAAMAQLARASFPLPLPKC